ncbi:outer membrane beta-barrel protein [Geomonas sp. RF6]|uniref:outer membrane protein n=1 Tax=Geomonas sp. RF6 TaxID=2897342 RepID=UPI001E438C89|nr:outer membrane beta-barrel protein [Geomonas sp. RF6]UFS72636.1 outer membrane beta-barrel protein [Geomonas sp. RF6]
MKKGLLFYAALLALLLLPASSFAARGYRQGASGPAPYLGVFAGVSFPLDADTSGTDYYHSPTLSFDEKIEFDPSLQGGMTAGFDFGMGRLEGELSYKHAEMTTITGPGNIRYDDADGRAGAFSVLFNGFIDVHNNSPVTPYFGGGIGFAVVHISDTYVTQPAGYQDILYFSDDDTVFAYQIGAGVGIFLTPLVSLDVGYRYFGTSKAHFEESPVRAELEMESHNVSVGVRFTF